MIGGEILDRLPRPTARYCPLKATSLLVAGESEFWHQQTASNSTVYTWKDAYLLRNLSLPFSMQAEIFGNGDFECRYDLSRIAETLYCDTSFGWHTNRRSVVVRSRMDIPLDSVDGLIRDDSAPSGGRPSWAAIGFRGHQMHGITQ